MSVLYDEARPHPGGYREIDPIGVAAFRAGAHGHEVRLIDVREPDEYAGELGRAPGAELVPLGTVASAATGWDKERELVVICRSGARSGRAAAQLASMGFHHVLNMSGGMLAWNAAHLPVER